MDAVMSDRAARTRLQACALGALAAALLALGLLTLWNFLSALAWAGIFAIALWPSYRRMAGRLGPRLVAPSLFTLGIALLFLVPLGLIGMQLAHEAHDATEWISHARADGIPEPEAVHRLPFDATVSAWWRENLEAPGSAGQTLARASQGDLASLGRSVGVSVARHVTSFLFTLVALFFLFRDGDVLTAQMRRAAARAFGPHGEQVGLQIVASVHGTVDGLVLVGLAEGLLMGVVYFATGVPHPTVFGALTAVAAMVPFAAPVVFAVVALLLFAQGSLATAVGVFCGGMLVTFTADHFVRPVLIGGATRLPFLWVLLGVLGGVETFGLIGLFLGPAIMSALILLWREWTDASG